MRDTLSAEGGILIYICKHMCIYQKANAAGSQRNSTQYFSIKAREFLYFRCQLIPPLRFVADSKSLALSSSFSSLLIFSRNSFSMAAFDSSTSAKCSWAALLAKIKSDKQLMCCDWLYFKSIKIYLCTINFNLYDLKKFMLVRKVRNVRRKAWTIAYHLCLEKGKNIKWPYQWKGT